MANRNNKTTLLSFSFKGLLLPLVTFLWDGQHFRARSEKVITRMDTLFSHHRIHTWIFLGGSGLLAILAAVVGISDNPPGILLALLAAIAFVLAFVHPWKDARQFRCLLYTSALGFILSVLLNNVFAAIAHHSATTGVLRYLFQGLAVVTFFLATMICPAAFIVSVVGLIVLLLRNHYRQHLSVK